ncbi:MAG: hypothetical protein WAM11_15710 [Cyanobium sp.]
MAIPSSPEPPGLPEIWQELRALRLELAELRGSLNGRPDAAMFAPDAGLSGSAAMESPARPASTATLLARRNGERLQQELRRRLAAAAGQDDHSQDREVETDVDLLIDRLHDLADASSFGP